MRRSLACPRLTRRLSPTNDRARPWPKRGGRETADQAEQIAAEQGDAEARGHSQAAQATAQRLEQVATARAQAVQQRLAARRERNAAVAVIRREAFSRAFDELGIRLNDVGAS